MNKPRLSGPVQRDEIKSDIPSLPQESDGGLQDLLYRKTKHPFVFLSHAMNNLINRPNDVYDSPHFKQDLLVNLDIIAENGNFESGVDGAHGKLARAIRSGRDLSSKENLSLINKIKEFAYDYLWQRYLERQPKI